MKGLGFAGRSELGSGFRIRIRGLSRLLRSPDTAGHLTTTRLESRCCGSI